MDAIFVVLLCGLISEISAINGSDFYYWKEYTGVIPPDAFPAGRDPDGRNLYIGEGYVHNIGLYVGTIYPGVKEVDLPSYGVKLAQVNVKILCTETPDFFFWVPTSSKTYDQDTAGLEVVPAGYDNSNRELTYVGRIFYQGYVVVGDVAPFAGRKGNAQLWMPFRKVERAVNFYEVLIVNVPIVDPKIGKKNFL